MSGATLATAGADAAPAAAVEAKPAEGADGDAKASEGGDTPAEPVYEFTAPEGVTLDTAAVDEFKAIAKELSLTPEAAQKVANVAIAMQQRAAEQHANTVTQWAEQTRADKELGGQALPETLGHCRRALDQFGTPEIRRALDESGLGNHPEFVRVFARVGKALADDTFVAGTSRVPERTIEQRLFPTMN